MEKNQSVNPRLEPNLVEQKLKGILERIEILTAQEGVSQKDFQEAWVDLRQAISFDPHNPTLLDLIGELNHLEQYMLALQISPAGDPLFQQNHLTVCTHTIAHYSWQMIREAYINCSEEKAVIKDTLLQGIPFSKFQIIRELAEGSFGKICLATWHGKQVVLKTPKKVDAEFTAEALISIALGLCKGENNEASIVMEYAEGGSLYDVLFFEKQKLTQGQTLLFAHDIASGLAYIHQKHFIHRDLKSANILLFNDKTQAKIADFGQSRHLNPESVAMTMTGTLIFMAPEVRNVKPYDESADIYSFGLLLYEMCTNSTLPIISKERARMKYIHEKVRDKELRELIMDCCKKDPKQRPTSLECLERITPLLEANQNQQRLFAARQQCRMKFKEFLPLWKDLDLGVKKSIVTMFLSLKYFQPDPTNTKAGHHLQKNEEMTNELIPTNFAFKEEFFSIANSIAPAKNTSRFARVLRFIVGCIIMAFTSMLLEK